jgi:hypothetical protein
LQELFDDATHVVFGDVLVYFVDDVGNYVDRRNPFNANLATPSHFSAFFIVLPLFSPSFSL